MAKRTSPVIGLVGCGKQGLGVLLPAASSEGLQVVAAHDADPGRLAMLRQRWPSVEPETEADRFFGRQDISAVIVALPGHLHYSFARRSLERGWHVFVEKPPGVTRLEVVTLAAIAARSAKVCAVGLNFRYCLGVRELRRVLNEGRFGRTLHVRIVQVARNPQAPLWQGLDLMTSLFFAQGIHALDLGRTLSGEEIQIDAAHQLPVSQGVALRLTFSGNSGVTGEVLFASCSAGLAHRVEVVTESGALLTLVDLGEIIVHPGIADTGRFRGWRVLWRKPPLASGDAVSGYGPELADFRSAASGGKPTDDFPTCEDALQSLDLFNSAMVLLGRAEL